MEKLLQKIGFSEKEARVYLAVLELGSATVIQIGKKAQVNRGTAYDILESLIKKGLVSYFVKGKKRYFAGENPKKLLSLVDSQIKSLTSREKTLEDQKEEIEKMLPELESIYNLPENQPKVRFFEGKEGIKNIYDELLGAKEIWAYGSFSHIYTTFPWFKEYIRKQINRGIKIRDLVEKNKETLEYKKFYQSPKQEMRFLPENIKLKTDNIIYGNKVAMISYAKELHGVVIESIEIADTQRQVFEVLWNLSKEK